MESEEEPQPPSMFGIFFYTGTVQVFGRVWNLLFDSIWSRLITDRMHSEPRLNVQIEPKKGQKGLKRVVKKNQKVGFPSIMQQLHRLQIESKNRFQTRPQTCTVRTCFFSKKSHNQTKIGMPLHTRGPRRYPSSLPESPATHTDMIFHNCGTGIIFLGLGRT